MISLAELEAKYDLLYALITSRMDAVAKAKCRDKPLKSRTGRVVKPATIQCGTVCRQEQNCKVTKGELRKVRSAFKGKSKREMAEAVKALIASKKAGQSSTRATYEVTEKPRKEKNIAQREKRFERSVEQAEKRAKVKIPPVIPKVPKATRIKKTATTGLGKGTLPPLSEENQKASKAYLRYSGKKRASMLKNLEFMYKSYPSEERKALLDSYRQIDKDSPKPWTGWGSTTEGKGNPDGTPPTKPEPTKAKTKEPEAAKGYAVKPLIANPEDRDPPTVESLISEAKKVKREETPSPFRVKDQGFDKKIGSASQTRGAALKSLQSYLSRMDKMPARVSLSVDKNGWWYSYSSDKPEASKDIQAKAMIEQVKKIKPEQTLTKDELESSGFSVISDVSYHPNNPEGKLLSSYESAIEELKKHLQDSDRIPDRVAVGKDRDGFWAVFGAFDKQTKTDSLVDSLGTNYFGLNPHPFRKPLW